MRIAVVCWSSRKVGGTESYLHHILPALACSQEVALLYETDQPEPLPRPLLPPSVPTWNVESCGQPAALAALRAWQPDVIYAHGLQNRPLETKLFQLAPVVFAAHDYSGFCISGTKTWQQPEINHCEQQFGGSCFLAYYPRRCGGLNPLTMLREYRRQAQRQANLRQCQQIIVFSHYTQKIYSQHGIATHCLPYPYEATTETITARFRQDQSQNQSQDQSAANRHHLLFLGRMDKLKGGAIMLAALPLVAAQLPGMLQATLAGNGPYCQQWQQLATTLQARHPELHIDFPGWVDASTRAKLFSAADLLVVPSLWPEPFGLIGQEAGQHGLPVAAFAAGGIPDWLQDGVNGHLAPVDPPTAEGLAQAIVQCLSQPEHYQLLCQGALQMAQRISLTDHLAALLPILAKAIKH
jgi:glycosyltransferase involved in cell wall biosynthesis